MARHGPAYRTALAEGKELYWTGKPCKHGHYSKRYTNSCACVTCRNLTNIVRAQTDYARTYYAKNIERMRIRGALAQRKRLEEKPEAVRAIRRRANSVYKRRHSKRVLADYKARQCAKDQRTPKWADLTLIQVFYRATPAGMHVDHVVPLRGRTVSGLHVLNNLQYLTEADNLSKGSKFDDWSVAV